MNLERGDRVAWTYGGEKPDQPTKRSLVHRAFSDTRSFCSREIPASDHRVSTTIRRGLEPCRRCEAMYKRSEDYRKRHPEETLEQAL